MKDEDESWDQEEEGEKEVMEEGESTRTAPLSTVDRETTTPVRPGDGLLKLIAVNPLLPFS